MSTRPFVRLDSPLGTPSLVLIEAPAPFRMARVELSQSHQLGAAMGLRGFLNFGEADSDVSLPGLPKFMLMEDHDDSWRPMVDGTYGAGAARGKPLPPYGTFTVGCYTFMFLPPTTDGLGIPPDYPSLTLDKKEPCTWPRLLVRAGHKLVLGRAFPLHFPVVTVGGLLTNHAPLFRLPFAIAARLTRVEEVCFFVEKVADQANVAVAGPREAVRILTPLASLLIEDWELVLLPPPPTARPRPT